MRTKIILAALAFSLAAATCAFSQTIVVTAPGAGMVLYHGQSASITWTATGVMDGRVKIRLWRMTGATSEKVLDIIDSTANDGSHEWPVPATVAAGAGYFIRVRTVDDAVTDDGDLFSIAAPTITVSSPMETGAYMVRGTTPISIAWASAGISGSVRIELENYDTRALTLVAAGRAYNDSPMSYPVPDGVAAGTYRVKVSQGSIVGYSGRIGILAYVAPSLSLVQPNGGEVLTQGSYYTIEWDAHNLDGDVRIELLRGGIVDQVLAERHFVNTGFFTWRNILSSSGGVKHMLGSDFKISIRTLDRRFRDVSEASFTIKAPPGIWVVKPAAGEVWDEDSLKEIRWNAQGLEGRTVEIILKFVSGSPLNIRSIARGVPAMDKRYAWDVMTLSEGPYNLRPGSYTDAVITIVTEGAGVRCVASSKEFTIRKR
ncbi:MAG: GPI anchored serine-threonine rich family protein [Acidobacteria bacterium]|jgi:hypothetical protein|nr:GPI anchored serine-threonine rich family protein [Acidobacteriota bacterium]